MDKYREAYALGARSAALLVNAAVTALELDRRQEALDLAAEAVQLHPDHVPARLVRARAMAAGSSGGLDPAVAELATFVREIPSREVFNELGLLLDRRGDVEAAREAFARAAALDPNDAAVAANHGDAARRARRFDEAREALERSRSLEPERSETLEALAALELEVGQPRIAFELAKRAARSASSESARDAAGSMALFALSHAQDATPRELFEEHVAWGAAMEAGASRWAEEVGGRAAARAARPARLVYLSPDFRDHVVVRFLSPVLRHHDPARVEVVLVSTTKAADEVTRALREAHRLVDLSTAGSRMEMRRRLHELAPDIIVELAGHSSDPVLGLLTPRVAPVQASYLGYPGTTGLSTIDYRITDRICDPPGCEADFTEELLWLPRPAWVYRVADPGLAAVHETPGRDRPVVFGSFNRASKLTPETLGSFAEILEATPGSRLVLRPRAVDSSLRARVAATFARIGEDRVELRAEAASEADARRAYDDVDIALDAFPYHGTTTTCDALVMGVPVVTRLGSTPPARVGASLLAAVGLSDRVASSRAELVGIANRRAGDRARLVRLRAELPKRVAEGPLGDARSLADAIETALLDALDRRAKSP